MLFLLFVYVLLFNVCVFSFFLVFSLLFLCLSSNGHRVRKHPARGPPQRHGAHPRLANRSTVYLNVASPKTSTETSNKPVFVFTETCLA